MVSSVEKSHSPSLLASLYVDPSSTKRGAFSRATYTRYPLEAIVAVTATD